MFFNKYCLFICQVCLRALYALNFCILALFNHFLWLGLETMYIPCYAFFKSFKIDNIKIESFKISKIENATSKNLNEEEQGLSENEEFDSLKCYILLIFFFNI